MQCADVESGAPQRHPIADEPPTQLVEHLDTAVDVRPFAQDPPPHLTARYRGTQACVDAFSAEELVTARRRIGRDIQGHAYFHFTRNILGRHAAGVRHHGLNGRHGCHYDRQDVHLTAADDLHEHWRSLRRMLMPTFTTRPEIRGTFGMVASTHWIASAVGMSVLEKGGNAFDAAAATGFTLQVVEPHLNGPLGEAPILVWNEANRRCDMICGQGVAPGAATITRFGELGLDLIPGTGLLAACVPGAFDAWMRLLRDYGTMSLSEILERAIGYAEKGYPAVGRIGDTIATVAELFRREWPSSAAVYLPHGAPPATGSLFRNPALAATYRRVLAEASNGGLEGQIERARNAWYRGFVAEAIDRFCRKEKVLDASGRRHGGLLTADDLARWEAPVEAPLTFDYRGYTMAKGGPWSQGPVLLQQLALLQGFDLDDLDPLGPDFVHTIVECAKLAFADREAWYGDPDFADVPMQTLLSTAYNDARRKLVSRHP